MLNEMFSVSVLIKNKFKIQDVWTWQTFDMQLGIDLIFTILQRYKQVLLHRFVASF